MGALYSFETALLLKKLHHKEPVRMFCSGISAPHVRKVHRADIYRVVNQQFNQSEIQNFFFQAPERKHVGQTVNDMSEEEFVEYLKKLGNIKSN